MPTLEVSIRTPTDKIRSENAWRILHDVNFSKDLNPFPLTATNTPTMMPGATEYVPKAKTKWRKNEESKKKN